MKVKFCFNTVPQSATQGKPIIIDVATIFIFLYEGWNFNSGNYLFTTDTK